MTKPNLRFINRLKAALRATPEQYKQDTFVPEEENLCGSPFCIAGHAYILAGHSVKQLIAADADDITDAAEKAMGLSTLFTEILFSSEDEWPDEFQSANKATAKQRVEKACKHIDAVVEVAQLAAKNPVIRNMIG